MLNKSHLFKWIFIEPLDRAGPCIRGWTPTQVAKKRVLLQCPQGGGGFTWACELRLWQEFVTCPKKHPKLHVSMRPPGRSRASHICLLNMWWNPGPMSFCLRDFYFSSNVSGLKIGILPDKISVSKNSQCLCFPGPSGINDMQTPRDSLWTFTALRSSCLMRSLKALLGEQWHRTVFLGLGVLLCKNKKAPCIGRFYPQVHGSTRESVNN